MTKLNWKPNPFAPGGDTQYQMARTPRFNIWRMFDVAAGQEHHLASSGLPEFPNKPGYTPHPEILLVTRGAWRFSCPDLPNGGHVFTQGDGAFKVRGKRGYVITTEDPRGNGYVCIQPREPEWFDREIVMIGAGEVLTLPARGADTFLYLGKGEALLDGGEIDPNDLIALPDDEDVEIEALSKTLGVTFWKRDEFPTTLEELSV
ncbi:hypothetical protein GTQ45_02015 [Pyruvatibacter mobilis]|uniref:Uncharacterized protein n=1 Tax=Pyruvatibacter mobilis TaxID=1712261 RepID=A0A845Q7V5_9HYPH|nr:hypothetical protein [Pyruvatibacter mobilis]NBG94507.1 hypothetical protein [Pyruvatibacter mobilis]QJD74027.1 hypothetical protein HG718_00565 [Pyruvatibacter mobilis]GGD03494.1 hypothetical protein GCM10011587_04030 [Pyruvatibacter mobilis]